MGWKDAPIVDSPQWANAPLVEDGGVPQNTSAQLAKGVKRIFTPTATRTRPANAGQAVQRLFKDTLETFTPPTSLDSLKRLLSPRVGQFGLSRAGQDVATYGQQDFNQMGEKFSKTPFGQANPKTTSLMRFMGSSNMISPEDIALGVGSGELLDQTVGRLARSVKTDLARRAIGATQSDLQSAKSWKDSLRKQAKANRAANDLLERGAISNTGSTSKTIEKVQKLRSKAISDLKNVLSTVDKARGGIDTTELALKMEKSLRPIYPDEKAAFNKIVDDIGSPGLTISLTEAKTRLKPGIGRAWDTPPTGRAVQFMRKAERFLENMIGKRVADIGGKKASSLYRNANRLYGNTETALNTLLKQNAREMGNALPSVRAVVGASGALAGGAGLPQAATTLGLGEAMIRRGAGVGANIANETDALFNLFKRAKR